jgi:hypothetical protein
MFVVMRKLKILFLIYYNNKSVYCCGLKTPVMA